MVFLSIRMAGPAAPAVAPTSLEAHASAELDAFLAGQSESAPAAEPTPSHSPAPTGPAVEAPAPAATSAPDAAEGEAKETLSKAEHEAEVARRIQAYAAKRDAAAVEKVQTEEREHLIQEAQTRLQDNQDDPLATAFLAEERRKGTELVKSWMADYLTPAGLKEYEESPTFADIRGQQVDPLTFMKLLAPLRDKHALEGQFAERLAVEKAKWTKEELPALRKQVLSELNGGEPSLDRDSGQAIPAKKSLADLEKLSYNDMPTDTAGMRRLLDSFAAA